MICPCKDCEHKGCGAYHSQCEAYLEYVKYCRQVNENERKYKKLYYMSNAKRRNKWKDKN